MKKVYQIIKFDLIGKVLYTCALMDELEMRLDQNKTERFYYKGTNQEYQKSSLWTLSTTPKEGAIDANEEFMPYFADVTEDLPGSVTKHGLKPKTYKNCQLMVAKHGGYLQFYYKGKGTQGEILRIAMNSHYYTPIETK